jgi:hypothetical protein
VAVEAALISAAAAVAVVFVTAVYKLCQQLLSQLQWGLVVRHLQLAVIQSLAPSLRLVAAMALWVVVVVLVVLLGPAVQAAAAVQQAQI